MRRRGIKGARSAEFYTTQLNMIDLTLLQKIADALHFIPFSWILFDFLKDILIAILTTGPAPKHVGFIMDGNRRFAKKKALPLKDGHAAGALSLISVWSTLSP